VLKDDLVYVADLFIGIQIINVSDPNNPTEFLRFGTTGANPRDLCIYESLLYYSTWYGGISVVNISNTLNPVEICHIWLSDRIEGLFVSYPYLYAANLEYSVSVFNITNPSSTYKMTEFHESVLVFDVFVVSNNIYLAGYAHGLSIMTLDKGGDLQEISQHFFPNHHHSLVIDEPYAYVGDKYSGLHVYNINCVANQRISVSLLKAGGFLALAIVLIKLSLKLLPKILEKLSPYKRGYGL
ncbi:MAG: hypothetical protein GF364_20350, partial [Candidatus Lokiarchaeota archaeon]|nr:hypothetical protein [Candidatus Lokiarchaeota archaeon]